MAWMPALRPQVSHEDTSGEYEVEEEDIEHTVLGKAYERYLTRLAALKPRIREVGEKYYPNYPYCQIKDFKHDEDHLIIGVIRRYGPSEKCETLDKLANEERVIHRTTFPDVYWPIPDTRRKAESPIHGEPLWEALKEEYEATLPPRQESSQKDIFDLSDMPERKKQSKVRPSYPKNKKWTEINDGTGYLKLIGDFEHANLSEGMVVGLLGRFKTLTDWDTFSWEYDVDWNWLDVSKIIGPSSRQLKWPKKEDLPKGAVLAIISGLNVCGIPGHERNTILAMTQFINWLKEELPFQSDEDRILAKKVARVLIAGENFRHVPEKEALALFIDVRKVFDNGSTLLETGVETLDRLLQDLTFLVPVDLMPGNVDLSLPQWPQQEPNEMAYQRARVWGINFETCTNPYSFQLGGLDFLATNGLNVTDILRNFPEDDSIDVMKRLLRFQHLAPTCPSSIAGYPFDQRDPLVLTSLPHIFIAGSQPEADSRYFTFGTSRKTKTLCLAVSKFSEDLTVTFLDLETLEVSYRHFGVNVDRVPMFEREKEPPGEFAWFSDSDDSIHRPKTKTVYEKSDESDLD